MRKRAASVAKALSPYTTEAFVFEEIESLQNNDFAELAVIDAYRWWVGTHFGFLQATGILSADGREAAVSTGTMDRELLRRIAGAYSVSRNIPAHSLDQEGIKLATMMNSSEFRAVLMGADLGLGMQDSRATRF